MPQCICGRFFTRSTFSKTKYHKEDDLCPYCKRVSTPQNYTNSKEWIGGYNDLESLPTKEKE